MSPHEALVQGRNRIEGNWGGWGPGQPAGRCALGGLYGTHADPTAWDGAVRALYRAIGIDPRVTTIPQWNDTPGRTEAEVLAAYDKAIAATAPAPDFDALYLEPVAEEAMT